jgi:crossover junction endodeoxyribonuclease RuvC
LSTKERIILGIDPGTSILGYGVIRVEDKKMTLLAMDVVRMDKIADHALKLEKIFTRCVEIIEEFHPDELAIEAPFFGKNVQSMLKLGRAQGVAIAAALSHKLSVVEYAPRKIKQSITGNGNASKEQVAAMLQQILKINQADMPKKMDATDGVAAAVCHYFQTSSPLAAKGNYKSWDSFLKNNPDRIR